MAAQLISTVCHVRIVNSDLKKYEMLFGLVSGRIWQQILYYPEYVSWFAMT